jgi:hypothetical protein
MGCEDCDDPLATIRKMREVIAFMAEERGLKLEGLQVSPNERGNDSLHLLLSVNVESAQQADDDWAAVVNTLKTNNKPPGADQ